MPEENKTSVVVEDALVKGEDIGVTVDLDKKVEVAADPKLEQLRTDLKAEFEKEFQTRIKPFINQAEQARRQAEQYRLQLEQTPRTPATTPQQDKDELDKLVDSGNWKEAVTRLADQRATAIIQQRDQQARVEHDALARKQLLDSSISKVTMLYPELDEQTGDPTSDVSKAFTRLMNQNPDLLSNPRGPEVVMYEMEREMVANGHSPRSWKPGTSAPSPATRAATTSLTPSRQSIPVNKVVLTREQKDFCDRNGRSYEDYAKVAKMLEATGGVEA